MRCRRMKVGIVMGSDSDLPIMSEAAKILDSLNIDYELTIVSAHRTPKRLYEYGENAELKGIDVIIAGAGGAAHLPGMLASLTVVPVIGVPVQSKTMSGVDSLYSIVQMPPGIPVATVAINGAKNAGLLAAKMIGIGNESVKERLKAFAKEQENTVLHKANQVEQLGYESYLNTMKEQ